MSETSFLTEHINKINPEKIEDYIKYDGYEALSLSKKLSSQKIISQIKKSGLCGRSGAGFPTGLKWQLTALEREKPKYIVVNGHEGEPGTQKDKFLLEKNPHLVLEGILIAARTLGANEVYFPLNKGYKKALQFFEKAVSAAERKNFLGSVNIKLIFARSGYAGGEETSLLNELEGKRIEPRQKPPFTSSAGLFGKPTLVSNVETFANIPRVILGKEADTKLISTAGDFSVHDVYEIKLGTTIAEIFTDICKPKGHIRFALVGGYAGKIVKPADFNKRLFYQCDLGDIYIGAGTIFAYNDEHKILDLMAEWASFFRDNSCGKCTPCREGTYRLVEAIDGLRSKKGNVADAIKKIEDICFNLDVASFCGLGVAAAQACGDTLRLFRKEIVKEAK